VVGGSWLVANGKGRRVTVTPPAAQEHE